MPLLAERSQTYAWPPAANAAAQALLEQYRMVFDQDARSAGRRLALVQITEISQPFLPEYDFYFLHADLDDGSQGPHALMGVQDRQLYHVQAELGQELAVQRLTGVRLWPVGVYHRARELRRSMDPEVFSEYDRLKNEHTVPILACMASGIGRVLAADPSESVFKEAVKMVFLAAGHAPNFEILESGKVLEQAARGEFAWTAKPKRITKFRFAAGSTGFSAMGWAFIQPAGPRGQVVKFQFSADRKAGLRLFWQPFGTVTAGPKGSVA